MDEKIILSLASISFHSHEILRAVKFIETESRMVVARAGGWGAGRNRRSVCNRHRASEWEGGQALEMEGGVSCPTA